MIALGRQSENLHPVLRHADCMFELRCERAIACDGRPAICQHFYMRAAEIDHRFDGKKHAGFQNDTVAAASVMKNIGFVVEEPLSINDDKHYLACHDPMTKFRKS